MVVSEAVLVPRFFSGGLRGSTATSALVTAQLYMCVLKPGLQYTQETGAKPRDFARTQAKKCLQSMRVCLQNFPACVTSQLVAQTTKESDHSFTVEFTTHKCTSTEENKMALACKKEGRIGFSFFVRCFVCASFLSSFSCFLIFCRFLSPRKSLKNFDTCNIWISK